MKERGKEEMNEYIGGPEGFERKRQVRTGCSIRTEVQN